MWDDASLPPPVSHDDAQPFDGSVAGAAAANPAWTDGQLIRLENEWRRAQRSFAYHPAIGIRPLRGDPPYEYQIDYRVRSLVLNEAGELQFVDAVSMHVWLPPGFPNQPPVVRPMAAVFHPNVAWEGVYITNPWSPSETMVEFTARIGELLAYRSYDPDSVVNSVAMDWLAANSGAVPLDARTDFNANAGGEPLGRIMRYGPATIDQIRRALDDMRSALLADTDAPTAEEVQSFARDTRAALSLFLEGDVPEHLREQASEFDDWCRELPASVPAWDYLRRQRTAAAAAGSSGAGLAHAAQALEAQFAALAAMVKEPTGESPAVAVKHIPAMAALQSIQLSLPPLARDFEQRIAALRATVQAMKEHAPADGGVAPEGSLGRRLAQQQRAVQESTASASQIAQETLARHEPLLRRTMAEVRALEQVVGWREYMDTFARGRALERQVIEWGSGGVQAYFIDNASGTFGPFQFEEALDLGGTRVAVRNPQAKQIEVIDAVGQGVLGRAATGAMAVVIGKSEGSDGYETTFRVTGRCDDLAVQFDFVQRQTTEALAGLQRPISGAESWCGKICALLSTPQAQQGLRDTHRKSAHHWKALILDLGALNRFKERLATHNLVARMSEEVPRVQELAKQARERLHEATQTISGIMSRSSRDLETDRLIVPPKYAKSYNDQMRIRDAANHEIARLAALQKQIAREVAARLASPRQCGRPEVPAFRALPPLPDALAAMEATMSDDALRKAVGALSARLGVELPFNPPAPPADHAIARPVAPELQTTAEADAVEEPIQSEPEAAAAVEDAPADAGLVYEEVREGEAQEEVVEGFVPNDAHAPEHHG